jgi:cell division protein FtsZ
MFEIQDAAKVITESIDPEAKIIFGTVRDDKLKKNEVKVTVIATGFPEGSLASIKSPLGSPATTESPAGPFAKAAEKGGKERGKIFNTLTDRSKEGVSAEKTDALTGKKNTQPETNDDDDWGAVPAFLRRSRLK